MDFKRGKAAPVYKFPSWGTDSPAVLVPWLCTQKLQLVTMDLQPTLGTSLIVRIVVGETVHYLVCRSLQLQHPEDVTRDGILQSQASSNFKLGNLAMHVFVHVSCCRPQKNQILETLWVTCLLSGFCPLRPNLNFKQANIHFFAIYFQRTEI